MGWVSPTGGSGTQWTSVQNAYDENVSTCAYGIPQGDGWTNWIELTVPSLLCNKIRFNVTYNTYVHSSFEAAVYYEDDYHTIYQGAVANRVWVEKNVIPGSPGQTKVVSKMRLRFKHLLVMAAEVYEADFNQVAVGPIVMRNYRNMRAG